MILGTIGAVFAGIAGGVVAAVVAPRFPFGHAAAVLLFLALDTASVLAKGSGPAFDLAGSGILVISVLFRWLDHRAARSHFCGASRGLMVQQIPLLLLTSSFILFFVVRGSRDG